jgi:hypothetical protein
VISFRTPGKATRSARLGRGLKVRSAIRVGGIETVNHSRRLMAVGRRPRLSRLSPESLKLVRRYFAMVRRLPQKERA